jgi:hypothetical protein
MKLTTFIFYNVPVYENGVFYRYAPQIEFITVDYVSAICKINYISNKWDAIVCSFLVPSLSSATVGSSPATASTTTSIATTTTTTMATAVIG